MLPAIDVKYAKYYEQVVVWTACGTGLRCTTAMAPLDWNQPQGVTITLALVKRQALGTRRGSILVNPGGPGESGVAMITDSVDAVDATLRKNFDIVGFDPRGVGKSTPVSCFTAAEKDRYLYGIVPGDIGSDQWIDGKTIVEQSYAAACAKNTGPLLAHVDTQSAARDLDVLRAILGETRLNYLGYSYGTFLGTVYAGLFPQRVGRMVFDGIDNPWASAAADGKGEAAPSDSFESALHAFLASCVSGSTEAVADQSCAYRGSADSAMTAVAALLSSVSKTPLKNVDDRMLGGSTLYTAITNHLYSLGAWPDLNIMLRDVQAGDPHTAFESADSANGRGGDGGYEGNSSDAFRAINCLDGTAGGDPLAMKEQAAELVKGAPVFGIYEAYGALDCSSWSAAAKPMMDPVTAEGAAPILLLGTTNDPATPYEDAQALAEQLSDGHLVTYTGEGHTAYNLGNSCVDNAVDRYFVSGTVPDSDPKC